MPKAPAAKPAASRAATKSTPKRRTSKPAGKRAPSKPRRKWQAKWLEAFERTGTVTAACAAVKINRTTAYDARKDDEFARKWDEIEQKTTDAMEREAYRRAVEGVTKPLVSAGKHVTNVTEYSDTLLIFMLKARKPTTYRENVKVEHAGKIKGGARTEVVVIPDTGERRAQVLELLGAAGVS